MHNASVFFTKKSCDRCRVTLTARIQSMFNEDCLCPDCNRKEEYHPLYEKAKEAEHAALLRNDKFFMGIGKPDDL